jgi:hypothetical protein
MDLSGRHAPAALLPEKNAGVHWAWATVILCGLEKRKVPCPCRVSNPACAPRLPCTIRVLQNRSSWLDILMASGAFAECRKVTISLAMPDCPSLCLSVCLSVRPSVRPSAWNKSAPTGRIFMELDITGFLKKFVEKIKVWLKYRNSNGVLYMDT